MFKKEQLRAIIQIFQDNQMVEVFKLPLGALIFGREKGDIILLDESISSTHCQIQCTQGKYFIYDMNSSNGTFVNGSKVIKEILNHGDKIQIGRTTIEFTLQSARDSRDIPIFSKEKRQVIEKSQIVSEYLNSKIDQISNWSVHLNINYPDGSFEDIQLQQKVIYVGRASNFGNFEKDKSLARRHLIIKLNSNGEIFVENQSRTHKSYINNISLNGMHLVTPNDTIAIGSCRLKIKSIQV